MDLKTKKKIFTVLYVLLIAIVITTCIFLIIWIQSESASCMSDPIEFFANKTENVSCYCLKNGQSIKP